MDRIDPYIPAGRSTGAVYVLSTPHAFKESISTSEDVDSRRELSGRAHKADQVKPAELEQRAADVHTALANIHPFPSF